LQMSRSLIERSHDDALIVNHAIQLPTQTPKS
jgi:hypothetical protein